MSAFRPLRSRCGPPTIRCGGHDRSERSTATAGTQRSVVGRAGGHRGRARHVRALFDLRGYLRHELLRRAVPLAAVLAVHQRQLRAPVAAAYWFVLEPLAGYPDRCLPARVPGHVLLLPPLVLPRVLLVASGVRDPRRAQAVRGRDAVSVPRPEPAPLRAHLRDRPAHLPVVGRDPRVQFRRALRDRARDRADAGERHPALGLLRELPFAALSRRRLPRQLPRQVAPLSPLELGQLAERATRALGLGESDRRRPHGPLHPPSLHGRAERPALGSRDMNDMERDKYAVVVIGAGGARLRAAIEANALGAKTAIVCKSLLAKANTVMAEGGIAAALGNVWPEDNWKVHFRDTMRGGKLLNNWRMAQLHAQEAPDRVLELEEWGALFDRTKDGLILQRDFGGHRYARLAHVGDRTGLEMIRTLQDHAVANGIDVFMECTLRHLLHDGQRATGAIGYWRQSGKLIAFGAKAVVLATGGVGKAWKVTSNSWEYTGDGMAMALDAGADLIDMEFVQFHPTGMIWPPSVRGLLVTEGVRGDGGTLKNSEGKRFMFDYIPEFFRADTADTEKEADGWYDDKRNNRRTPDLLPRDEVARASNTEVKAGRGTPHGGVYLDIASRRSAEYIKKRLPSMYHQFKELADVDITKQQMEIGPTLHYIMGGIRVDPDTAATTVPGLYAAGEVAAGMHGANRLGGNSLSDLLVFGRRAGQAAAEYSQKARAAKID